MGRWYRRQTRDQEPAEAEMPGEQVWSLAAVGALIGAILGWLTASGALPHPDFLPIPDNAILTTTLVCATIGALSSGLLGLIGDLSNRWHTADSITDDGHTAL
jgi:hypothetical protein